LRDTSSIEWGGGAEEGGGIRQVMGKAGKDSVRGREGGIQKEEGEGGRWEEIVGRWGVRSNRREDGRRGGWGEQ